MEKKDKITREDLRAMRDYETRVFLLPDAQACDTGKTVVSQMKNILQCNFTVKTDYANNALTVTKSPMQP